MTAHRRPPAAQPDLLGGASAERHRLFLCLMPDEATRARMLQAVQGVLAAQPLAMRATRPERYHLTLHFLGDHPMFRQDIVNAAVMAAGKVRGEPFELVLDSAGGFQGRQPPCILRCPQAPAALQSLWQSLYRELTLAGQGALLTRQFTPHVTFGYSHGTVLAATPIEPVTWSVDQFALIYNEVGGEGYRVLGEWGLGNP